MKGPKRRPGAGRGTLARRVGALRFDGTIRSVLDIYKNHPASTYRKLKPSSRKSYDVYLGKVQAHAGDRLVADVTYLDVKGWHKVWIEPPMEDLPRSRQGPSSRRRGGSKSPDQSAGRDETERATAEVLGEKTVNRPSGLTVD